MSRLLNRIRAWWWMRQWVLHGRACRQCAFAAEAAVRVADVERCCELGLLTAKLAAHYALAARPPTQSGGTGTKGPTR